jgi:hypothetical protein
MYTLNRALQRGALFLLCLSALASCNIQDDVAGQGVKAGELCSHEGDRQSMLVCRDGRWGREDAGDMPATPDQSVEPDQGVEPDQSVELPDLSGLDMAPAEDMGEDMDGADLACRPLSDEALCGTLNKQCGDATTVDSCGTTRQLNCGVCAQGECQADGTCSVCQPESDVALCARSGRSCGMAELTDNCGMQRMVACGECAGAGERCATVGQCVCEPETDEQLCGQAGRQCGQTSITDRCGVARQLSCGTCAQGTCGANGTCSVCQPESDIAFCARNGAACGGKSGMDNCGNARSVASCGACGADEQCNNVNACVCPAPSCPAGAVCGAVTNACGRSVTCGPNNGSCTNDTICTANNQCICPAPSCPAGAQCGTVTNACGGQASCGSNNGNCGAGQSCANNVCMCVPETNAAFCTRYGAVCGSKSGPDNCGTMRTVNS